MDRLNQELGGLLRYVERVRQEIAAIDRPVDEDHHFDGMGDQLDAIVKATEQATGTIMEAVEASEEALGKLRGMITDPDQAALLDRVTDNGNVILEACAFQDITGQRVNKVVKSITYVENRVAALVDVWGKDQLADVVVSPDREKTADEKLMNGPQLDGAGLSQNDIDSLFD